MLTIRGGNPSATFCDGISRRDFLNIGGLTMGGLMSLSLAELFRAEARGGAGGAPQQPHQAVIHVFLAGGPSHQDLWDIKTGAPVEIRGEFQPIATNVPGIAIGEVFPRLARLMDKVALIRSVVGAGDRHEASQCHTGWTSDNLASIGGRPSVGAVVSRLKGPLDPAIPPFVGLAAATEHKPWCDPGAPGFLGPRCAAFQPDGPALANMRLGIAANRLADRRRLLASFDQLRRECDAAGALDSVDSATAQAFDVLTSSRLIDALDLSKEDPKLRDRYGTGRPYQFQYDGAPTANEHLLIARRLVEAGARCVTLSYGRWDTHTDNFQLVRDHGSKLDQCLSALIEDLDARGLLAEVTVIAWGEFGRTPQINPSAGRDHWSQVNSAFLAGGGMRTGQVIGATNRLGEYAKERPVSMQEIVATLYHNLGIDVTRTTITDPTGRPQYLVDARPIAELV